MKRMKMMALMMAVPVLGLASTASTPLSGPQLEAKVRRELVTLPFLSIYDSLRFTVDDGGRVTLKGETIRPVLKSDAGNVVKRIPGVTSVDNQIEVLPLSPNDDRIRLAVTRAVYGFPALNRYALGALPSIHIIVKDGNVTLKGVVLNEMDRNIAFVRANGVPGAFNVENQLQVENPAPASVKVR